MDTEKMNGVAIAIPSEGLVAAKDGNDQVLFEAARDIKDGESVSFPAELVNRLRFTVEKSPRK